MTNPTTRTDEPPSWWQPLWDWFDQNTALLGWLMIGSIASLVLVIALLPVVVVRLPADYFDPARPEAPAPRTLLGWTGRLLRNVLGWLFVVVGLLLLLLPGQGLLT
ncbi:MAG: hypothetical protein KAI24_14610, partial [Planctomycetes bacterium]|nr:hypothetical protein [Planctomycetota bacterium]